MTKIPLLDLGNVVVQVDFSPFLRWLESKAGRGSEVSAVLRSSLFYDLEFGSIRPEQFSRRLANLYGAQFSFEELKENFCAIFPGMVPGMEATLERLAAAGPLYALSNTNELHLAALQSRFPALGRFSRIFASHTLGRRKPYPGIYVEVARELGQEPGDFVFFDDVAANVEGALRAGMEAHVFESAQELEARVKDFEDKVDNANMGRLP